MTEKFKKYLLSQIPNLKGKKILLAISGGLDSVTLLHLLKQLEVEIILAHANFQLRGKESEEDELFVNKLAKKNGLKIFCKNFKIKKTDSVQERARELRYEWFQDLMQKNMFDYLATAHHQDDQIETFFLNLFRGAGIKGLSAMPFRNKNHIRPLLNFSKSDIEAFSKENKIKFREDSSNSSDKYNRNYIRHHILPLIKDLKPSNPSSIIKSIENIQNTYQFIILNVDAFKKEILTTQNNQILISKDKLLSFKGYRFLLHYFLEEYGFTAGKTNEFLKLMKAKNGKKITSQAFTIVKTNDHFFTIYSNEIVNTINNQTKVFQVTDDEHIIDFPIKMSVKKLLIESSSSIKLKKNEIFVNIKKIAGNQFTIRPIEKNDSFTPFGSKNKMNAIDFLKKQKVPLINRKSMFVLLNCDKIIWVVGERMAEQFKCDEATKTALRFQLSD